MTVKLRGSSIEISVSYREMNGIKEVYKELIENDEDTFEPIYNQAVLLARVVNTEPSIPRIAQRMSHRANAIASTPEEYYRRNMFIPFLDHIRCELDTRFSAPSVKIMQALSLIPSVMRDDNFSANFPFDDIKAAYKKDHPQPELLKAKALRWKVLWRRKDAEEIPETCVQTLKACSKFEFPNIFIIMKIICTTPVTSCECERSASVVRRLHTYNRACMNQDRLSSLALIHINYDMVISQREIIDMFITKKPRRVEMKNLFSDY